MEFINYIWKYIKLATVIDVIDILIVAFLIYKLLTLIKNTSAERLLKGVFLLILVMQLSDWLSLNIINFLLSNMMQLGFLSIVIVFQPELRKMLEQFGRSRFHLFKTSESERKGIELSIVQTTEAVSAMSWTKTGVLIVFEKEDKLDEIIQTGTEIDAVLNAELLKNIFYPKAPLHDGAVIVRDGRITAAGCLLPISSNLNLSKELGTRHRAAVGVSEKYDCSCVVVSEESGALSFAHSGMLKRHLAPETLERLLINELVPQIEDENKDNKSFFSKLREKFK